MAAPSAKKQHAARELLTKFGVGKDTLADRWLSTAAYGDSAVTVPSPDGKSSHVVWATDKASLEDVAGGLLKRFGTENPTTEQLAAQVEAIKAGGGGRDDAALLAQLNQQQKLGSQGRFQRLEAVEALMDASKQDEKLRAALAPHFGFQPSPEPAPIGKDPAVAAAPATTASEATPSSDLPTAAMPPVNSGAVKAEPDNWWTASQPELQNIPVLGGMPRWGLAALGVGVPAGAGLAYHLMAQGQQQSDPVAYASTVQAMNAY